MRGRALALASAPLIAGIGLAALVPQADAAIRRVGDGSGRTITFDVRASGVDVAGYGSILRRAVHGDEISGVTIRIVPRSQIASTCGSGDAVACYGGRRGAATIVVPATSPDAVRHSLLHEYGHHVDANRATPQARSGGGSGDGSRRWWSSRGMTRLLSSGQVAFTYQRGWSRSVGEIYAEDYVQLHVRNRYGIPWLNPPGAAVLRAMRLDITGRAAGPAPENTGPSDDPGVGPDSGREAITDDVQGVVRRGATVRIPFGLLGPGRGVDFVVEVTGRGAPASVRTALVCDGRRVTGAWAGDTKDAAIKRRNLGPANCTINLTNVGASAASYDGALTLSRPRAA